MAVPAAVLSILVTANTGGAAANLTRLDRRLKGTAATGEATGARVAKGAKIAALGLAAGAGASVYAATKFESAFAEVRKTVDTNEKGFKRIEKGLRGLATKIPVSANELANLAGEAGALGVKSKDIVRFTKTASMLGTTTDLASSDAANALARLSNIMDTKGKKSFERMGSTLVDLGNKGASTEQEISDMALRIAGAGKTIGLTEAQVLGLSSSLANVGIRAEMGGSAISRVMLQMQDAIARGGSELAAFAEVAGISTAQFTQQFERNAPAAIAAFAAGLGRMNKAGESTMAVLDGVNLNEIRVRDTLLRIAGNTKNFTDSQNIANEAWRKNNALTKEAEKRYETFESQLAILRNNLVEIGIAAGQKMLPALKETAEEINSILSDKDLTGAQKFDRIASLLTEKVSEAFSTLVEKAAEVAPRVIKALASGFAEAWQEMNPLGKLFTAAALTRLIGGKGAMARAGARLGAFLGVGFSSGAAAAMGGGAAAGGAAAGSGVLGSIRGALSKVRWARIGGVGIGIALADIAVSEFGDHVSEKSDQWAEAMKGLADESAWEGAKRFFESGFGFGGDAGGKELENARKLRAQLSAIAEHGAATTDASAAWAREQIKGLDVTKSVKNQMLEIVALGEERRKKPVFDALKGFNVHALRDARKELIAGGASMGDSLVKSIRERVRGINLGNDILNALKRHPVSEVVDRFGKQFDRLPDGVKTVTREAIKEWADGMAEMGVISEKKASGIVKAFDKRVKPIEGTVNSIMGAAAEKGGKQADNLRKSVVAATSKTHTQSRKELKPIVGTVNSIMGDTAKKGEKHSKQFRGDVVGNFSRMAAGAVKGIGDLAKETNKALKSLNVKERVYQASYKGSKADFSGFHQRGGVIEAQRGFSFVNGSGSGDKVPAMLEPGEVVVNRQAVKAMGGPQRVNMINEIVPRFQKGGAVGGNLVQALGPYDIPPFQYDADHAGGNSHWHIHMSTTPAVVAIGKQLQKMGFMVGEHPAFGGVGGSHSPTGGHPVGLAIDVNSAANETRAETARVAALLKGKGGVLGAVADKLKRVLLEGPKGPLRDAGQSAIDKVWKGANAFIAKHTQVEGGETVPGLGAGSLSRGEVRSLLRANNMPDIMGYVAYAESQFNPKATSYADARGLWQIHWPAHASWASKIGDPYDPNANAQMAARLHSQEGLGPWSYSQHEGAGGGWGQHVGDKFRRGGIVGMQKGGTAGLGLGRIEKLLMSGKKGQGRKAVRDLRQRIKLFGLSDTVNESIAKFTGDAEKFQEWGSNAATLDDTDFLSSLELVKNIAPGATKPFQIFEGDRLLNSFADKGDALDAFEAIRGKGLGDFMGGTEGEWLAKELDSLFRLRNWLIYAHKEILRRRDQVAKFMKKAGRDLKEVRSQIRTTEKERNRIERQMEDVRKRLDKAKGKQNKKALGDKLDNLRDKFKKKGEKLRGLRSWESALESDTGIIPRLESRQEALATSKTDILDQLSTVQGAGGPMTSTFVMADMSKAMFGQLGGNIFSAQNRLRELGIAPAFRDSDPASSDTDRDTTDDSRLQELQGLRLDEALDTIRNLRTRLFQRPVFGDFMDAVPQFHQGGIYRSPTPGGEGLALLRDREQILTPEQRSGGEPNIEVNVYNDPTSWEQRVEVLVDGKLKQEKSRARRRVGA